MYGLTEEIMKNYMPFSDKKIIVKCPNCRTEKIIKLGILFRNGLSCNVCSDNISYPNKFLYSFITQLPVNNIIREWCEPDWLLLNQRKSKFDIYFEYNNQKYVIEADGELGHGNDTFGHKGRDVEGKIKDIAKENLAKQHGINVIRIDCKRSQMNYIKENILKSYFDKIFDLSNINWIQCHQFALSNIIKKVAELWELGYTKTEICNELDLGQSTVSSYLKQAANAGWCSYTPTNSRSRGKLKYYNNKKNRKGYKCK